MVETCLEPCFIHTYQKVSLIIIFVILVVKIEIIIINLIQYFRNLSVQHDNRSHRWSSYEPYDTKEILPHLAEKPLSSSARSLSEESIQVQQVQLSLDHILSLKQTDLNPAGSMKTGLSHSEVNLSVPQKSENSFRNVPVIVQVVDNDAEVPQRNHRSNSQGSRSSVGRIESIEEDVAEFGNTSKSDDIKGMNELCVFLS